MTVGFSPKVRLKKPRFFPISKNTTFPIEKFKRFHFLKNFFSNSKNLTTQAENLKESHTKPLKINFIFSVFRKKILQIFLHTINRFLYLCRGFFIILQAIIRQNYTFFSKSPKIHPLKVKFEFNWTTFWDEKKRTFQLTFLQSYINFFLTFLKFCKGSPMCKKQRFSIGFVAVSHDFEIFCDFWDFQKTSLFYRFRCKVTSFFVKNFVIFWHFESVWKHQKSCFLIRFIANSHKFGLFWS